MEGGDMFRELERGEKISLVGAAVMAAIVTLVIGGVVLWIVASFSVGHPIW
jgi:hypothetical protein